MENHDKATTALVRSMKRTLEAQHGITVPHSALRASYLQALGENPHAFAGRAKEADEVVTPEPAVGPSVRLRKLYLCADEVGCLEGLSLDEEGSAPVPCEFVFKDVFVERQFAYLPRVSKYGLPDYLANGREFFSNLGLAFSGSYEHGYKDLYDDSGDSCCIWVSISDAHWNELLVAVKHSNSLFRSDVIEWVREHHGLDTYLDIREKQYTWTQLYLDSMEGASEMFTEECLAKCAA